MELEEICLRKIELDEQVIEERLEHYEMCKKCKGDNKQCEYYVGLKSKEQYLRRINE